MHRFLLFCLIFTFIIPALAQKFQFSKGQQVYIVAIKNQDSPSLQVQRLATDQFVDSKIFPVSNSLSASDFVFLILVDESRTRVDEIALALLPADYEHGRGNFDSMRKTALWQSDGGAGPSILPSLTFGISRIFHRPSVSRELVKRFHREVGLTK